MTDIPTLYKGEGILLAWADSSARGRTVTFQLTDTPDDPAAHPFKGVNYGKTGQRVGLVVVALAEDQHDPPTAKPGPETAPAGGSKRRFDELPRSQQAALMCERMDFQRWLHVMIDDKSALYAAAAVRAGCGVSSRSHLDTDEKAAREWDNMLARFRRETGRVAEQRGG